MLQYLFAWLLIIAGLSGAVLGVTNILGTTTNGVSVLVVSTLYLLVGPILAIKGLKMRDHQLQNF